MDIDLSVLRSLESEKDISLDQAIKAIEDALLVAYHKSEGASTSARVEVDRKSGHVTVWATQTDPDGRSTTYQRDAQGYVTLTYLPGGATLGYQYEPSYQPNSPRKVE